MSNRSLNSSSYRVVFFDLFHTLIDVAAAPGASGRYTADILGVDRAEWNAACFSPLHDITRPTRHEEVVRALAHSIDSTISAERIREAAAERQQRFDHALLNVEEEVLETLRRLRARGIRIGLISNASSGEVSAWSRSPLAALFDVVLFSCECGECKPQPAIYRRALASLGIEARAALFVGDGGSNEHAGARAVGLTTVLITRHLGGMAADRVAARREHCTQEIARLPELLALLDC